MKLQDKPRISSKIQKMMRIRDRILQKLKKQQTDDNLKLYKMFRNRVSNELKESKARYYHNYFSTNSNNMKKLWSGIKTIISHKSFPSSAVNKIKDEAGNVTSDPCKVTNIFNDFFVNVANEINKKSQRLQNPFLTTYQIELPVHFSLLQLLLWKLMTSLIS